MKTALITGVSGKIGKEIAKKFIENGYFVMGVYNRNENSIKELNGYLSEKNLSDYFVAVQADISTIQGVDYVTGRFRENFSHIDVLVNNAGVDLIKLCSDTTEEEYDEVFNVNVKASYFFASNFIADMVSRQNGKIIFVSSIWGVSGASMESAYSASKFALVGLTKSLAKELGESNINVNCVCPGVIDSPMNDVFSSEEKQELINRTPLKRMGEAKEVASVVYYLSSDEASFITGQAITLDGGFTL